MFLRNEVVSVVSVLVIARESNASAREKDILPFCIQVLWRCT